MSLPLRSLLRILPHAPEGDPGGGGRPRSGLSLPPIEEPETDSARLVPVPSGCLAPEVEQTVFIGKLLIADAVTGRYEVEQVLSGSIEGFSVQQMIDRMAAKADRWAKRDRFREMLTWMDGHWGLDEPGLPI